MLKRDYPVVFLAAWADACALWRLYMPHLSMPGSSFHCFGQKPIDLNEVAGNDICVVQRCNTQAQFEFLRQVASLGMYIIYDLDDNVWNLPDYNPAKHGLMMQREGFNACIRMVDVVVVSTRELAKAVKKNVRTMINLRTGMEIPIVVAENRIERRMFAPPVKNDKLTIGWAGSSSHIGDIVMVKEALINIGQEIPDIDIEFRGCELAPDDPLWVLKNFRHKLWTPVAEFGARMPRWGWHIALAPVTDHLFNACKSNIKMVEAAYCGIPCLASWVAPYDWFCSWDSDLKWLLIPESVPSMWERKLRELINDEAMREHYGKKMHQVMLDHYSLDAPHDGWKRAFTLAYQRRRPLNGA